MRVIHLGDAPRERWRNDGGWTREIVRAPEGEADYDWRLSVAEVESAGPFSHFGGCDRILMLLSGEGMALHSADSTVVLRAPRELLRFASCRSTLHWSAARPTTSTSSGAAITATW